MKVVLRCKRGARRGSASALAMKAFGPFARFGKPSCGVQTLRSAAVIAHDRRHAPAAIFILVSGHRHRRTWDKRRQQSTAELPDSGGALIVRRIAVALSRMSNVRSAQHDCSRRTRDGGSCARTVPPTARSNPYEPSDRPPLGCRRLVRGLRY